MALVAAWPLGTNMVPGGSLDPGQPHSLRLRQKLLMLTQILAAVGPQTQVWFLAAARPERHHGPG